MAELKFLNIGILSWITFLPLIAILAISFVSNKKNKNIQWIAVSAAFIQVLLSIFLWIKFNNSVSGFNTIDSLQFIEKWNWINIPGSNLSIEYFLAVDGLSLPMIILTSLLSFTCLLFTFRTEKSYKAYFILFLILDTSVTGSFASMDFFLFFMFSAAALIPVYFLTGIFGGDNRIKASSEFLIQSFAGSIIVLVIMLLLFYSLKDNITGSHSFSMVSLSNFKNILNNSFLYGYLTKYRLISFIFLFAGFALRLPLFPFHSRIIAVLEETPAPVSGFIAGIFIAQGLYSILRIALPVFPDASVYFAYSIAIIGLTGIIYGSFCAIAQHDSKRAVTYYTVSITGFILVGIASITIQGISGATLQMLNAGLIVPMLFLIAQYLQDKAGTLKINELGNLSKLMPRFFILSVIIFFAVIALPGLNNFISTGLILSGGLSVPDLKIISIISLIGILVLSVFFIWLFTKIFFGSKESIIKSLTDISIKECIVFIPAVFLIILLGVYPSIITNIISSASTGFVYYISSASNLMRTGW